MGLCSILIYIYVFAYTLVYYLFYCYWLETVYFSRSVKCKKNVNVIDLYRAFISKTDPKALPSLGYSFHPQCNECGLFNVCHSNTAPTVLRPMRQTVSKPNDRYLGKLGLEPGSMHSPRSQVQYSIDSAKKGA